MDETDRHFSIQRDEEAANTRSDRSRSPEPEPMPPKTDQPIKVEADAFPDRIRRKYYLVGPDPDRDQAATEIRVYTDQRGEYLAFKDTGDRLTTRLESAQVIRDMVSVAEHRGWEAIMVRGSAEFRREVWLEASSRGIEVRGHEPTDLDRAARDKLAEPRTPVRSEVQIASGSQDRAAESTGTVVQPRLDYDAGVSGRLAAVGTAPFRDREGAKPSPYVDLDLEGGRSHRIWGVGLREALARSDVRVGDQVTLRRDGFDLVSGTMRQVDVRGRSAPAASQEVRRNRWTVVAERFRTLDRGEAVRDPILAAAHSQIAVIERGARIAFPDDEKSRTTIVAAARERAAEHLAQGRPLRRAEVRSSEREVRQVHPMRERSRERTRDRERGPER